MASASCSRSMCPQDEDHHHALPIAIVTTAARCVYRSATDSRTGTQTTLIPGAPTPPGAERASGVRRGGAIRVQPARQPSLPNNFERAASSDAGLLQLELFGSQSRHRIDGSRPASREIAGGSTNDEKEHGNRDEARWIVELHSVEKCR